MEAVVIQSDKQLPLGYIFDSGLLCHFRLGKYSRGTPMMVIKEVTAEDYLNQETEDGGQFFLTKDSKYLYLCSLD